MNIYQSLYDLVNTYIFGGAIAPETVQDLACTLLSLSGSIFVFAIPFLVVWKLLKVLIGD